MRWSRQFSQSAGKCGARVAAAALCASLLIRALTGCTMGDLTLATDQHFPPATRCGDCHVEIYREWSTTAHAHAYSNERFRQATDDYRFEHCLGCHAPEPAYGTDRPAPRQASRNTGVSCVTCHLAEGQMAGPLEPTGLLAPHPIRVAPDPYLTGPFCGRCHEGTLAQWRGAAPPDKPTCPQCHMPEVVRKMTQATSAVSRLIVAAEEPTRQRRHTFDPLPIASADPLATAAVVRNGTRWEITLRNHVPHNLPTGDFGLRDLWLQVEAPANQPGRWRLLKQWTLSTPGGRSIPAAGARQWEIDADGSVTTLRISLIRPARQGKPETVLTRQEMPAP